MINTKALTKTAGVTSATKRPYLAGWQIIVTFDNGYGASVINHAFSYGTELAVTHDGRLCYATPVTGDVIGNIADMPELTGILTSIAALPRNAICTHS